MTETVCVIDPDDIEVWELEEFLEDILNAEFNLVRDADNDGTDISQVSHSLSPLSMSLFCISSVVNSCQFFSSSCPLVRNHWARVLLYEVQPCDS